VQQLNDASTTPTRAPQVARELLAQAHQSGRAQLTQAELQPLLKALGLTLQPQADAPGNEPELRVRIEFTREFGAVLHAGLGGVDGQLDERNFQADRASVHAVVALTDGADFLQLFRRTLAYQKLALWRQSRDMEAPDTVLTELFGALLALARACQGDAASAAPMLTCLDIDALRLSPTPQTQLAQCTLGAPPPQRLPRPIQKIERLIHPRSIGIIGVSGSSMNFGRIILRNLAGSGYPKQQLVIIRPDESEIDGVRCVPSLRALPEQLDLLIVAIAASAVYELVDEIIETDSVAAVMLIPGSLGETEKSREPAAALGARINAAHAKAGGGPIFLGANCLGVVSHPGQYDSWFIPLERLPKPQKKAERNAVMLSQSGAFMITRLSQNPWLDPRYMLALGNQTDLTHGDMLSYFANCAEINTIGVYVEGFKDGDGHDFALAVRQAVRQGKQVVVYKSGRTAPGAAGVMGHTASIAGELSVFESVLRHAGAIVARDFNDFDDLFYLASTLHDKAIHGNRLGAISGAGFEAVGMADNIHGTSFSMQMGALQASTIERVQGILQAKRLDALVEVRNPIDINPGADDEAHLQIAQAFIEDPNIDAVVIGLDPTAPSVRALEQSQLRPGFDLSDPKSTVHLMPPLVQASAKPIIGVIDGGSLYDAMAARLMDQGVCVFRNCARATQALVRYAEARLNAERIKAGDRHPA